MKNLTVLENITTHGRHVRVNGGSHALQMRGNGGLLFACKTPTYPFYEPYGLTVWFSEDTLKRGENVYLTLRFKNTYDSATVFYPNAWIMLSHYDNSSITESYLDNIERGFYPLNSVTDTTSSMQLNPLEVATLKFKITVDTPFFYTDGANPIEVVYRYTELDKSKKKRIEVIQAVRI